MTPKVTDSTTYAGPGLYTTQCVIAATGSSTDWEDTFTVATPDNEWMITISNGQNSGNPTPGRHPLVGVFYPSKPPANALTIGVESRHTIAAALAESGQASYVYTLGAKVYDVTVDPSLTSGSLDMTFAPAETNSPSVTVSGTWSCA